MIPIFSPSFSAKEKENLVQCIESGWVSSQGDFIPMFEEEFARWNERCHGVTTSNCTTALHLSLAAMGIGKGDEVLCPDLSFIAPANMIRLTGATPVLVDVEEPSWAIDPSKMEASITPRTKAIIVVHPFGHSADMDPIMEIAGRHDLHVIEDVAEAPGAEYKGRRVGTFGEVACYSFFANKIMTTGEGGIVLTNDSELDQKLRVFRDHGMSRSRRYVHIVPGFNYRMTNMQAAVGVGQLERLDETLALRAKQEESYKLLFADDPRVNWRPVAGWCNNVHWLSTITLRHEKLRDPLLDYMNSQGIDCRQMVYPIHMAEPYAGENSSIHYPISRSISLRSLHLPSSLLLTADEMSRIAETISQWLRKNDG